MILTRMTSPFPNLWWRSRPLPAAEGTVSSEPNSTRCLCRRCKRIPSAPWDVTLSVRFGIQCTILSSEIQRGGGTRGEVQPLHHPSALQASLSAHYQIMAVPLSKPKAISCPHFPSCTDSSCVHATSSFIAGQLSKLHIQFLTYQSFSIIHSQVLATLGCAINYSVKYLTFMPFPSHFSFTCFLTLRSFSLSIFPPFPHTLTVQCQLFISATVRGVFLPRPLSVPYSDLSHKLNTA